MWFAPAIPVGLGPHKLGGLPGLILEARSKDGFVVFDFRSYETLATKSVALQKPSKGKEMTWEELKKLTICSLLEAEAMSSEDSQTTLNAVPTNWDIEYNKYPFIADYKRERLSKK